MDANVDQLEEILRTFSLAENHNNLQCGEYLNKLQRKGRNLKATDKRVIKTKAAIYQAIMELMTTTSLAQINVSALARQAHIDRKTFYAHFATPTDAFASFAERMVSEIVQGMHDDRAILNEAADGKLDSCQTLELNIKLFFGRVEMLFQSEEDAHRRRAKATSIEELFRYFIGPLKKEIEKGLLGDVPEICNHADESARFLLLGSLWTFQSWLSTGRDLLPDEKRDVPLAQRTGAACNLILNGMGGFLKPGSSESFSR